MQEIISKKQAKELGLTHYFTGIPCKNGHIDKAYVSSGSCFECEKIRTSKRTVNQKQKHNLSQSKKRSAVNFYKSQKYREYASKRRQSLRDCPIQKKKQCEYSKKYREKYPEKIEAISKARRSTEEKTMHSRKVEKAYYEANKERIKPIKNLASRNARKNNIKKRLECNMRAAFKRIFKMAAIGKDRNTFDSLGYTAEQLKQHIERQFNKKMTWDNYASYWEIDHITPVSVFFKNGEMDPRVINCLTNLRPLECSLNRSKQAKIEFLL